jgi:hypothetical protein
MTEDAEKALSFHKKKQQLRMKYKQWKVGLIVWDDLNEEEQYLLTKYYGVNG